ncbi:hypothetical protein [Corynebacterium auris]|uniref:hypothetical protein n=1 Tax=Corynebacterium auris TaxID=44750 RepID=UPI0025B3EC7D|nr:hypothetical protein [Corynebacterium auris]WJY68804.1 Rossmann-like domain protein [Corynebacterium auris]
MGPLLRVGVYSGPGDTPSLGAALERAGHTVAPCTAPDHAAQHDLVVLATSDPAWLRFSAPRLEPYARRRQMFVHTCLSEGVQVLDVVELRGAVTMAAHEIQPGYWVTSAADDVGEAVVSLLVTQAGGVNVPVNDAQRPRLAAAARLSELAAVAQLDALELLSRELPGIVADVSEPEPLSPQRVDELRAALDGEAAAGLYAQLERRQAQRRSDAAEKMEGDN